MRKKLLFLFAALLCSLSMFADGALSGKFTINLYGDQISFSQGNLQYRQSDNTYRFALSQYAILGALNQTALETIDAGGNTSVYIDLFGWGTGTAPYFHSTNDTSYPVFYEWGNEPITNGNSAIPWRTMTHNEWDYLLRKRNNAVELFALGKVNGVNGLILLPDEWETPSGLDFKPSTSRGLIWDSDAGAYINTYENNFTHNTYSGSDWDRMEQAGAVFLPAAGSRQGTNVDSPGQDGWYWSSSSQTYETAYCINFDKGYFDEGAIENRSKGMSVRLVQDVPKLEIYSEFVESTGTLTYYYDTKRLERTGVTELYDRKRTYFPDYATKVKKGIIDPSMKNAPLTNTSTMFYYYSNYKPYKLSAMTSIQGLENLNTAIVTNMREMFYGCSALTSLDLSSFNTSNVTDMAAMFSDCDNLASLDLSSFNTAKVTNMYSMFAGCHTLTSLDVSSFDISKVTYMDYMFYSCLSLKTIYCNDDWSTSDATSNEMFDGCTNLVGGNRTKYVYGKIDKTYARPDGGTDKPGYFTKKPKMKLYTEFDESTGTLTYYYDSQREERTGPTELYDPENNPDAVRFTGYYTNVLKAVIDPSMKNAPLTSFRNMFYGNMDTSFKFHELNNMTSVEGMENLNTADVTNMRNMFGGCYSLATIDLSSFNTSKVTDMQGMFTSCRSLTSIDVSTFDISNVTEMRTMFIDCPALKTIYCSNDWSTSTAQSGYMFSGCTSLIGGKGTAFDKNVMDNTYARPDGGTSAPGYFTEKPAYMVGDANGNGEVEIGDVTSVLTLMATPEANGYNNQAADANGNGEIEIGDVTTILTIMAGN